MAENLIVRFEKIYHEIKVNHHKYNARSEERR